MHNITFLTIFKTILPKQERKAVRNYLCQRVKSLFTMNLKTRFLLMYFFEAICQNPNIFFHYFDANCFSPERRRRTTLFKNKQIYWKNMHSFIRPFPCQTFAVLVPIDAWQPGCCRIVISLLIFITIARLTDQTMER